MFRFKWGCCCDVTTSGCCLGILPTTINVTIPELFSSAGNPCDCSLPPVGTFALSQNSAFPYYGLENCQWNYTTPTYSNFCNRFLAGPTFMKVIIKLFILNFSSFSYRLEYILWESNSTLFPVTGFGGWYGYQVISWDKTLSGQPNCDSEAVYLANTGTDVYESNWPGLLGLPAFDRPCNIDTSLDAIIYV